MTCWNRLWRRSVHPFDPFAGLNFDPLIAVKMSLQECRSFECWAWFISATSSCSLVWSSRWVFWLTNASTLQGMNSEMKLCTLSVIVNAPEQQPWFSLFSMQQGKMFFFIGVIMALIQGGYARRIKPGHHIKAVRMVGVPSDGVTNSFTMIYSLCCWKNMIHHYTCLL